MKKMVRYRYLPHTADVKYVAFGKTLGEAFRNSALALFDTIADIGELEKLESRTYRIKLRITAHDNEELLWKMLQHLLSAADSRGLFCYSIPELKLREKKGSVSLESTAFAKGKSERYSKLDVKGISKYSLKISRTNGKFRTSVVVDV